MFKMPCGACIDIVIIGGEKRNGTIDEVDWNGRGKGERQTLETFGMGL
jgi:hypothetical protein